MKFYLFANEKVATASELPTIKAKVRVTLDGLIKLIEADAKLRAENYSVKSGQDGDLPHSSDRAAHPVSPAKLAWRPRSRSALAGDFFIALNRLQAGSCPQTE